MLKFKKKKKKTNCQQQEHQHQQQRGRRRQRRRGRPSDRPSDRASKDTNGLRNEQQNQRTNETDLARRHQQLAARRSSRSSRSQGTNERTSKAAASEVPGTARAHKQVKHDSFPFFFFFFSQLHFAAYKYIYLVSEAQVLQYRQPVQYVAHKCMCLATLRTFDCVDVYVGRLVLCCFI